MQHPIQLVINIGVLIFLVIVLFAAPAIAKQNPIWFWGFFILAALRLAFTMMASSQEEQFESQALAAQQQAERAVETTGQAAGTVWLYRIPSFIGKLNSVEVYCDGAPMASLPNGSFTIRKVAPGKHAVSAVVSATPISLSVEAGQEYFVRTGFTGLVSRAFEIVSRQQAQSEMSRLKEVN